MELVVLIWVLGYVNVLVKLYYDVEVILWVYIVEK